MKVIEEQLVMNGSMKEQTSIPAPQLVELIELCLRTTYFIFQDTFYEQLDGAAMGSPSPQLLPTSTWSIWNRLPCRQLHYPPDYGSDMWMTPLWSGHMDKRNWNTSTNTSTCNIRTSSSPWRWRRITSFYFSTYR